jgi:hypothetical protein
LLKGAGLREEVIVFVRTLLITQDDTKKVRDLWEWNGELVVGAKNGVETVPPFRPSSPTAAQLGHEMRPDYSISNGLLLLFGANGMRVIRTLDTERGHG